MKLKNKIAAIITIVLIAFCSLSPCCYAEPSAGEAVKSAETFKTQSTTKPYKSSELKHVLKKFIFAMALVGGSCIVLYVLLSAYKRVKTDKKPEQEAQDVSKNLTTPETVEDAARLFIEKF